MIPDRGRASEDRANGAGSPERRPAPEVSVAEAEARATELEASAGRLRAVGLIEAAAVLEKQATEQHRRQTNLHLRLQTTRPRTQRAKLSLTTRDEKALKPVVVMSSNLQLTVLARMSNRPTRQLPRVRRVQMQQWCKATE